MVLAYDETDIEVQEEEGEGPIILTKDELVQGIGDIEALIQEAQEDNPYIKLGLYGPPGVGKTWLAASFPDPLILEFREDGSKYIPYKGKKKIRITKFKQAETAYWYLKGGNHPFKTVALDTTTGLAELAMDYVKKEQEGLNLSPDPNLPNQRDYQKVARLMGLLILYYKSLDMNVIFICGERKDSPDGEELSLTMEGESQPDDQTANIFPELSKSVRSKLFRSVDILGRMTATEEIRRNQEGKEVMAKVRRLYTTKNTTFEAKDRTDSLPRVVINPTYDKIEQYLQKKRGLSNGQNSG